MNKDIKHATSKMMLEITDSELKDITKSLEELTIEFNDLTKNIPNLKEIEPQTHTIEITDIVLREDIPVASPDIDELLKNTTNRNGREIEVPKVVG